MGSAKHSPYPDALVARVAAPPGDKKSAVLVARNIGYLCVKITFHREPIVGLDVRFFEEADNTKRGEAMGEAVTTSERGVAMLGHMVPAGRYICAIERQPETVVTTVADALRPFVIPLPVGRPHFDAGEAPEFDSLDEQPGED